MKAIDIRRSAAVLTILFFGGLSAMGGYIANGHPDLLETWKGLAMIGAPAALGFIFLVVSMLWKLDDTEEGPLITVDEGKGKPEVSDEDTEAVPETEKILETVAVSDPGITVVQILGLLQREGRLIDFLQEDITPFSDEQIGAAVREVHKGCRNALSESFKLEPVLDAVEGSEVEVDEDFNPLHIKLVGNIHGKPPFKGVLRHCGWRYSVINLPEWTAKEKTDVVAPAEVEIL